MTEVQPTVTRFVDALAYNWIIGGTDAHAKNYSLLLDGEGVLLAPLYDVASILPCRGFAPKAKLAMKIGSEYCLGSRQPQCPPLPQRPPRSPQRRSGSPGQGLCTPTRPRHGVLTSDER